MTTFGDAGVAQMLLEILDSAYWLDGDEIQEVLPAGFSALGAGLYRVAILDQATEWVYKFGDLLANQAEVEAARRLAARGVAGLPYNLIVPRTEAIPGVTTSIIVQEWAKGATPSRCDGDYIGRCSCGHVPCHSAVRNDITSWAALDDMHAENVLIDADDNYWVIDMAGECA